MSETLELARPVVKANNWYGGIKPDFLNIDAWIVPSALRETRDWKKPIRKEARVFISFLADNGDIIISQNGFVLSLLQVFNELAHEIEESKFILHLEENYDDAGSVAVSESTWVRTIIFLTNYANWIYENTGKIIDTPQINPGPKESVDILWQSSRYRLLINIPSDLKHPVHFYGDNTKGEDNVKGSLQDNTIQDFFAIWLSSLSK